MPSRRQSEKAFDCRAKEGSQRKRKEGLSCLFRARMLTNRAVHKNRSGARAVGCGERLGSWPSASGYLGWLKVGRGVPKAAMAPTTSSQNGITPRPGIASSARPGSSNHCRPRTRNSRSAVTRSTAQVMGGAGVVKAPITSETPAMATAIASCFFENFSGFAGAASPPAGGWPLPGDAEGGRLTEHSLLALPSRPDLFRPSTTCLRRKRRGLAVSSTAMTTERAS
jgi:hypothetical protein